MMLRVLGWGALLTLLATRTAHAQGLDEPSHERDGAVQVVISGVPDAVKLRIADADSDQTVAQCRGRCVFSTEPGRYRVYTFNSETDERHELGLRVRRAGRFRLEPGDETARNVGLVVGIAGPVLFLSGVVAPSLRLGFGGVGPGALGLAAVGKF